MFLDITKKLDHPDFVHSVTSFVKTYEDIKTDSAMVAALSSFGKCVQTKARGCKRQKGCLQNSAQIGVQLTAVSGSKSFLDEGRILSNGRPPKVSRVESVCEITIGDQSVLFHPIPQCVEESVCL